MKHFSAIILGTLISAAVLTAAAAIKKGKPERNLQVLPKDISDQKLDSIMMAYNKALKVDCNFCHVKATNFLTIAPGGDTLDYAKDGNMKEYARKMIHLMIDINNNYFNSSKSIQPAYLNTVSCNTCHRGSPYPEE